MVKVLNSIALTEVELGEYESALEHFNRALQINRHLRNQAVEAKLLSNLGRIFSLQKLFSGVNKPFCCHWHSQKAQRSGLRIYMFN